MNFNDQDNLNYKANNLIYSIESTLDLLAPVEEFFVNDKDKQWFTPEVKSQIKKRDHFYRLFKTTNDINDWNKYKMERNETVALIHKSKKNYHEKKIEENRNDPKNMYKTINNLLKKQKQTEINCKNIKFENLNHEIRDDKELADKFNDYFVESIESIIENNENNNLFDLFEFDCVNFLENFDLINLDTLFKLISNLETKKKSLDGIDKRILLNVFESIGNEFVDALNLSLSSGICPEKWKLATLTPIRKVANSNNASDFRPINQLPMYEKILELFVKQQLQRFLDDNNILIKEQSGFRHKFSCETALQLVFDEWTTAISERKYVGVIFIDYKRAFETIDRNLLINKLFLYGIRGKVLNWFKSYIFDRKQRTSVNGVLSDERNVNFGVPQGSVLGPILFILYINDLKQHLGQQCEIRMFADDTMLYVVDKSMENMERRLNSAMKSLDEWMGRSSMFLNTKKTFYMIFKCDQ